MSKSCQLRMNVDAPIASAREAEADDHRGRQRQQSPPRVDEPEHGDRDHESRRVEQAAELRPRGLADRDVGRADRRREHRVVDLAVAQLPEDVRHAVVHGAVHRRRREQRRRDVARVRDTVHGRRRSARARDRARRDRRSARRTRSRSSATCAGRPSGSARRAGARACCATTRSAHRVRARERRSSRDELPSVHPRREEQAPATHSDEVRDMRERRPERRRPEREAPDQGDAVPQRRRVRDLAGTRAAAASRGRTFPRRGTSA